MDVSVGVGVCVGAFSKSGAKIVVPLSPTMNINNPRPIHSNAIWLSIYYHLDLYHLLLPTGRTYTLSFPGGRRCMYENTWTHTTHSHTYKELQYIDAQRVS